MGKFFRQLDSILNSKYLAWFCAALFFAAGLTITFTMSGTGDDGDSIMHYQFARWSWAHHELFFNHWAKPLYVLIASPFAQFGLSGIKIFNISVSAFTILITFSIADTLKLERKALTAVFMIASPGLLRLSVSGLTEPLFALTLSSAVLLYLRNRYLLSVIIISFLPFVRSEGLIICCVFAVMLVIDKRWLLLPTLLLGHVVYGIVGFGIKRNVLWGFTQIPYARLSSIYGHGGWPHFFFHLPDIIGFVLPVPLAIGIITAAIKFLKKPWLKDSRTKYVLVYGSFLSVFIGHVIFWKFGIFNSLGLLRVLLGVLPMMCIIELEGLNNVLGLLSSYQLKSWILTFAIFLVIIFPFTRGPNGWHKRDFTLSTFQQAEKEATDYIKSNYPQYKTAQYYFDANYVSILMDIDYFDTTICRHVWEQYDAPPKKQAFILWDDYYSKFENSTPLDVPMNNPRFELVRTFTMTDPWNYEKKVVLFKTRDNPK